MLATTETTPLYAIVLIAHVLVALVGLVQVGVSYAEFRRVEMEKVLSATTFTYYASPPKLFSRVLVLVPVTGALLLGISSGRFQATSLWVMAGGALWFAAFGLLEAGVFANERAVAASFDQGVTDKDAARKGRYAATAVLSLIGIAAVLMVLQPGS